MGADTILGIIVGILIFNFVLELILDVLNLRNQNKAIPEELKDLYTEDEWKKAREYQQVNFNFGLLSDGFSLVITVVFILLGGFGWLYSQVENYTTHGILLPVFFFGVLGVASSILGIPFSLYHTFVIEERFGFNKTTMKTWISDRLKSALLSLVIGFPILAVFFYLIQLLGKDFWWAFGIVEVVLKPNRSSITKV
jgi:STE24 endopeptidase